MISITPIILVLFCTFIGSIGSLFFKLGSSDFTLSLKLLKNWRLILGFFLYGVSAIIYIIALRYGELSIIYPLVSISYIWVMFWSHYFLGEKITNLKMIGVASIVVGVVLIGINA